MKGGFNKILRNIVAGANDTEFEKVGLRTKFMIILLTWMPASVETHKSDFPPWLEGAQREARHL